LKAITLTNFFKSVKGLNQLIFDYIVTKFNMSLMSLFPLFRSHLVTFPSGYNLFTALFFVCVFKMILSY